MKKKNLIVLLLVGLLVMGCGTSKKVSVLQYATSTNGPITILGQGQQIPTDAILLGSVKIDDTGFTTKCSYAEVIKDATEQAQAMGGNILYIRVHKEPSSLGSSCHRIECDVYKSK